MYTKFHIETAILNSKYLSLIKTALHFDLQPLKDTKNLISPGSLGMPSIILGWKLNPSTTISSDNANIVVVQVDLIILTVSSFTNGMIGY